MESNSSKFKISMDKTHQRIIGILDTCIQQMCDKLLNIMMSSKAFPFKGKGYTGFTGQTQTSYTVAMFLDSELRYFINSNNVRWKRPPVRSKLRLNEIQRLPSANYGYPYEGNPRTVKGAVEISDPEARDTAERLVTSVNKCKGFTIAAAVGTEYQPYIQKVTMHDIIANDIERLWADMSRKAQAKSRTLIG